MKFERKHWLAAAISMQIIAWLLMAAHRPSMNIDAPQSIYRMPIGWHLSMELAMLEVLLFFSSAIVILVMSFNWWMLRRR